MLPLINKESLDTVQSVFRITKDPERGKIIKNENLCDIVTNIFNLEKIPTISDRNICFKKPHDAVV